ncbi:phage tail protein, partial [Escherichia coli]|nr:phage tail protein [Escherichia coli]
MAAKKDDIMKDEIVAEENTVDNAEAAEEKTGVQLSCPVVRGERVIDYVEIGEEIR